MSGFFDPFGGTTLKPAEVGYRALDLVANLQTEWPPYASEQSYLADTMNVLSTSEAGLQVWMPDARQASPGVQTVFYNSSVNAFLVTDATGNPISSVEPGARRLIVLIDNGTEAGGWITTILGAGTGNLDVAGAAGAGLFALGTTLNVAFPVQFVAASRPITDADRATAIVWTGGSGTLQLPPAADLKDMSFEIRNQGTGTVAIAADAGQQIDGSASISFNNAESAWIHAAGASWHTVGRGRNAQFNFTQLQKTVTGGSVVLSLTEAANVVQTYTGVLTSNVTITLPAVVQVYYVSNQTTGAFSMTFRNPAGGGTTVSIPQGQNAILFSDGTNVVNASTTIAGITSITFAAGSAANPSVQIGSTTTGLFSPSSGVVAMSSNGVQVASVSAAGSEVSVAGNASVTVQSTGATATFLVKRPAGQTSGMQIQSGSSPRVYFGSDGGSEAGANAGSNPVIFTYKDDGTYLETPFQIDRKTGIAYLKQVRDKNLVGEMKQFVGGGGARAGFIKLDGTLLGRTAYPDLFAYAAAQGLVSEADFFAGWRGRFSVGDGVNNFRVPDLRGMFLRILDDGAGWDPGRNWGHFQDQSVMVHSHGLSDPGHNHFVNDPSHGHGAFTNGAGGHNHGVNDPGHAHNMPAVFQVGGGPGQIGGAGIFTASVTATHGAGTGIWLNGVGDHAHGVGVNGAVTGIWLNASGTGQAVQNSGSADGHPRNIAYPIYVRY